MFDGIHPADDSRPAPDWRLDLADSDATEAAGAAISRGLVADLVIWLEGDLGAGKTTLTRGILRGLGHQGSVKSPTYTLLEPYVVSRITLYHFDFYRFNHPDEFLEAGLEEYFHGDGVCIVEWADKALPHVAAPDLLIQLELQGEGRALRCFARTNKGQQCLNQIRNNS